MLPAVFLHQECVWGMGKKKKKLIVPKPYVYKLFW